MQNPNEQSEFLRESMRDAFEYGRKAGLTQACQVIAERGQNSSDLKLLANYNELIEEIFCLRNSLADDQATH